MYSLTSAIESTVLNIAEIVICLDRLVETNNKSKLSDLVSSQEFIKLKIMRDALSEAIREAEEVAISNEVYRS